VITKLINEIPLRKESQTQSVWPLWNWQLSILTSTAKISHPKLWCCLGWVCHLHHIPDCKGCIWHIHPSIATIRWTEPRRKGIGHMDANWVVQVSTMEIWRHHPCFVRVLKCYSSLAWCEPLGFYWQGSSSKLQYRCSGFYSFASISISSSEPFVTILWSLWKHKNLKLCL